ncbi:MAG: 4-hydroxy-tetrahydrodipicolinate synthase, partial [Acidobacteriota bacterium]
ACLEAVAASGSRASVVAGTGSNATARAAAATRRAAALGAHGALVVTPYYNKPNDDGMVAHFEAVAAAAPDLPLVIYNVPGRTAVNLTPGVLERIWRLPTAVAIKESSGDLSQIDAVARELPAGKIVLAGDDAHALASIALGARGLVSVIGNLLPSAVRALVDSALDDRFADARALHGRLAPLMESLFVESNPVPLKAALALRGLARDVVRAPLAAASEATRRRLAADLASLEEVAA